jgi:BlaI family penicillinase repressor
MAISAFSRKPKYSSCNLRGRDYYKTKSKKPKHSAKDSRAGCDWFSEANHMARPRAKELTERELEIMHVFWKKGEATVSDVRDLLAAEGRDLAYTTVATLVRILTEKSFLQQTNDDRPFRFAPVRSFEEVSGNLLGDLVKRVFGGSREKLLVRLMDEEQLSPKEREALEQILKEQQQ